MSTLETIIAELLAWLFLALLCGLLAVGLRRFLPSRRLFPPQRHRAVPWTGPEVCLAALIPLMVLYYLGQFLTHSGFLDYLYGLDFQDLLQGSKTTPNRAYALERYFLWAQALAYPLQVALLLVLFRACSGTRPYQLGLTLHRGGTNVVIAARVWLVVTPLVFVVNFLADRLHALLVDQPSDKHPLTQLVQGQALTVDWMLLVFLAVVAAPFWEELFFRGILQPWFARRPWGGLAAWTAAFLVALLYRSARLQDALEERDPAAFLYELGPALFVLVLGAGFPLADRLANRLFPRTRANHVPPDPPVPAAEQVSPNGEGPTAPSRTAPLQRSWGPVSRPLLTADPRSTARALYGTAVLFAAVHSSIWPSPVALFVLALALGWLANRTQSVVSSIVLHALFNGVACLSLFLN